MQILGRRSPSGPPGITPVEIALAVEQIIAAVADEYGLVEARDAVSLRSRLHDDLGMDEVDLIEVMFRGRSGSALSHWAYRPLLATSSI
jgi:hypothetical protein